MYIFVVDVYDIVNDFGVGGSDVKIVGFLILRVERVMSCGLDCCVLLVRYIEVLMVDRMVISIREVF